MASTPTEPVTGSPTGTERTLDTAEVERFQRLAREWWDPTASFGRCTRSARRGFPSFATS